MNNHASCISGLGGYCSRTAPSYRMALEAEIESWKSFREALRIDERQLFDDLMNLARERASAGGASVRYVITEAMFMTILFQHHKLIKQLEKMLTDQHINKTSRTEHREKQPIESVGVVETADRWRRVQGILQLLQERDNSCFALYLG